ncbi:MAG: efflux RND transporter periplasmic adaptor subunit [Proteobacteria bacterium]|nr:efflux RND transporter periplasmic adaptor subunit [Pseudomonadota bacterium]
MQAAPPPPVVTVATPLRDTIIDHDEYVGRFVAVDMVEIRARVSGYLDQVHFTDGQVVAKGDRLFTIDQRPFENALAQARATLAQTRANLAFAQGDLERAAQLVRQKTVTEQVFDQRTQANRVAEAAVRAQEAAVQQAELDLQYSDLRAPIAGRIGDRRVSPGNLVNGGTAGNTTLLATIVSLDPIRFEFTFDESSYLRAERLEKSGMNLASASASGGGVKVSLRLIDEQEFSHDGHMDFVDNVIDRSSGTIRGRAVFANSNRLFTPGMFARIRVPASPPYTALLVPDAAIGTEQARRFVLVVEADNAVRQVFVTLGQIVNGMRVVRGGLNPDDRVIVNGLMRARAGQKVTPQVAPSPPPPPPPPTPAAQANPTVQAN